VINLIKHQEGVDFKVVSALEKGFQAKVWRERRRKLDFSCILSLNPYQSEVNNMLQMINSFNFMLMKDYAKLWLCEIVIYVIIYRNDANYVWTMLESMNYDWVSV
jgi:hypothetical protein